jgi:hypothetical protein
VQYHFNARWYDAETARFISEDPARDGGNWFVYVGSNPLGFIDFSGLSRDRMNTWITEGGSGADSNGNRNGSSSDAVDPVKFGASVAQGLNENEIKDRVFSNTQQRLVGEDYVWAGNDIQQDGGLDCSGAILCGLREMGYDVPDMTADDINDDITLPLTGEPKIGNLRFIQSAVDEDESIHVQTLTMKGRVNPRGTEENDSENPGVIEFLFGQPPESGPRRQINWNLLDVLYGGSDDESNLAE